MDGASGFSDLGGSSLQLEAAADAVSPGAMELLLKADKRTNPGSLGHPELCRRRCVYIIKGVPCRLGSSCNFCHLEHFKHEPKLDQKQRYIMQKMTTTEKLAMPLGSAGFDFTDMILFFLLFAWRFLPHFRSRADQMGLLELARPFMGLLEEEMLRSLHPGMPAQIVKDRHTKRLAIALSRMSLATLAKLMLEFLPPDVNEAFEALREVSSSRF